MLSRAGELSTKIICGDCGGFFGRKSFKRADGIAPHWRCNGKYEGRTCQIPDLSEEYIHDTFVKALNIHLENKEEHIREALATIDELRETRAKSKAAIKKAQTEFEEAAEKYNSEVSNYALSSPDNGQLAEYDKAYKRAEENYSAKKRAYLKDVAKMTKLTWYVECVKNIHTGAEEYDPELFRETIEKVVVKTNGKLTFYFVNGTKVTV